MAASGHCTFLAPRWHPLVPKMAFLTGHLCFGMYSPSLWLHALNSFTAVNLSKCLTGWYKIATRGFIQCQENCFRDFHIWSRCSKLSEHNSTFLLLSLSMVTGCNICRDWWSVLQKGLFLGLILEDHTFWISPKIGGVWIPRTLALIDIWSYADHQNQHHKKFVSEPLISKNIQPFWNRICLLTFQPANYSNFKVLTSGYALFI